MSTPVPFADQSPPTVPGLEFHEKIGEGGGSVVFRATHRNLDRMVAVKVLRTIDRDPAGNSLWLRESRLMASLAHPHVVTIHDAGQAGDRNYLIMEFMAGGSLRSRMRPGHRWTLNAAKPVIESTCQALEHIHALGVLHLDLKPENILYSVDGQIKITDFGISVPQSDVHSLLGGDRFQGTLDYCAPERRSGLSLDPRYDVFALATIAYELLTGKLPGRVYVPVTEENSRLPKRLDRVLERGLARNACDRYATVAEFRRDWLAACQEEQGHKKRLIAAVVASACLLVIFPLAVLPRHWLLMSRGKSPASGDISHRNASAIEQPDRLVVLYDDAKDLSLFAGLEPSDQASGLSAEQVMIDNPRGKLPEGVPLSVLPTPRPLLAVHSPGVWGFVHPFDDPKLAQRVVANWSHLSRAELPPGKNLIKAGDFVGDCLAKGHTGELWRAVDFADWDDSRQIIVDHPADRSDNPALLLKNMAPTRSDQIMGCYQPIARGPAPGSVLILRYRAKSLKGTGSLSIHASLPVVIPKDDQSSAAARLRRVATRITEKKLDPVPNRWLYRCPAWVTPNTAWQTYIVVLELPPFGIREVSRNMVIAWKSTVPAAVDQVWVDDIELFVWEARSNP